MASFKANYMSRMSTNVELSASQQTYEAVDLAAAMTQHERCTQIMQANYPEYECNLVTMSETK